MTGNGTGVEGAKAMSEMLKGNTTLKTLFLHCEEKKEEIVERKKEG